MERRAMIVMAAALLVVAALPTAASATPPETQTITGTYDKDVLAECEGFDVVRNGSFTVVITTFFGTEGEPVRVQVHVTRDAVAQNSVSGKTARDDAVWTLMFDVAADTLTGSGQFENIRVPGYGLARYDIGHFIASADGETFAGQTSQGNDELCAALATS